MPELPDVEIFRRYFERTSLNQTIQRVELRAPGMLQSVSRRRFLSKLERQQFLSTHRHGKYLFAEVSNGSHLVLHFGMTGQLRYFKEPIEAPLYIRLLIKFVNGYYLAFDCQRKLGKIGLTGSPEKFIQQRNLGPDVLAEDFDLAAFKTIVQRKKGRVKSILMDQHTLAGIGNLYADEILYQSQIHPATPIDRLTKNQKRKIFDEIKSVLQIAIQTQVDARKLPAHFLLKDRGRNGKCPLCGTPLGRMQVGGRTTYFCPKHQRKVTKGQK